MREGKGMREGGREGGGGGGEEVYQSELVTRYIDSVGD